VSDVDALIAAEKLREAAAVAVVQGESALAVALLERAALPAEAAEVAERAGDLRAAVRLAAEAGDVTGVERIAGEIAPEEAAMLAPEHARRPLAAAALHERSGNAGAAAEHWARAGEATRAAACFEAAGEDRAAARVLADRLETSPGDVVAAIALGSLCARHGRWEAATTTLQRAAEHGPLGADGDAVLARSLAALGLAEPSAAPPSSVRASDDHRVLFGRWEVLGEIAASPTARVLAGRDRLSGESVAIKLLRPAEGPEGRDAIARLEREARALALLRHPRVVPMVAWVREGPALVLARMAGGSLADRLAEGPLPAARAAEIARAVLEALAVAHRIGVLHRDVKPANVLFDAAGSPYLADFGAAHVGDAAATITAGLIGTLAYMAPEQRRGQPATTASDVYAVGAMLLESLTGAPPAADAPAVSVLCPALDRRHDEVLARMLADDPAARFASAEDARVALASVAWPEVARPTAPRRNSSARPGAPDRFRAEGDHHQDELLARPVRIVPLDTATRTLARAFARADDDALASVYALREGRLIVEPQAPPRTSPLSAGEVSAIRRALVALHGEGVAHGSVDEAHVGRDHARGPVLAFPATPRADATPEDDLASLARLARSAP
jgi:serine/threonine-protein kinase